MKELMEMIGKRGYITVNGWIVGLTVQDVKRVFGTEKLYCTQHGRLDHGQWINRDSFTVVEANEPISVSVVRS